MVVLAKSIRLNDLRGKRVFPRLAYAVALHAGDRAARRSFAFFLARPWRRIKEFFRTVDEHRETSEIVLAGFAVLSSLVRAYALLVLAVAIAIVAVADF